MEIYKEYLINTKYFKIGIKRIFYMFLYDKYIMIEFFKRNYSFRIN
jgi:hypothetical protein